VSVASRPAPAEALLSRRRRLDAEIVRRGLASSRTEAAAQISLGRVLVNGALADKPARQVDPGDAVVMQGPGPKYVSRGGLKLEAALAHVAIEVAGRHCLDVGQSTGGFTEVLLARGAASVVGVDVGHGQLHSRLRDDPRVTALEGVNARQLDPSQLPRQTFDLVVADLSFISLTLVLPALVPLATRDLLLLVKPQFELQPADIGKGGLVTSPAAHAKVEARLRAACTGAGFALRDYFESTVAGGDGNREHFLWAQKP